MEIHVDFVIRNTVLPEAESRRFISVFTVRGLPVQTCLLVVSLISDYLSLALKLSYWLHLSPSAADGPPDIEKRDRLASTD